ncbi:MAG: hypothetical protein IPM07_09810 [Anaerolineales bacterium]|nr:hypothetical protein [Anaerolineales bacterium]
MLDNLSVGAIAFLVGAVTAILLYLLFLWWRNPVLMKIGLRNLTRRPGQSVLITIGLTLSTIIVISSLGVGDTLRYSVQKQAVSAYGKVDGSLRRRCSRCWRAWQIPTSTPHRQSRRRQRWTT